MADAYDKIQTTYDRICNYREDATYNKEELIGELVSLYTIISDENAIGQDQQLLDFIEKQIDIVFLFPSSTVWSINDVGDIVNSIMTLYRMGDVKLKGVEENESQNTDTGSAKESNGHGDSETAG